MHKEAVNFLKVSGLHFERWWSWRESSSTQVALTLVRDCIATLCTFRSENPHEGETIQCNVSGAGGIRTLVQTRKPYAFYMLILAFIFVP